MKVIKLQNSSDVVALVDDEDYERLQKYRWLLSPKGYIIRYEGPSNARVQYRMHNEVLNLLPNSGVDHIDNAKWNNTKENLRVVTHSVNSQNKLTSGRNTTGYKGVSFDSTRCSYKKFKASIGKDGKVKTLGYFETAKEAADAYDKQALEIYGSSALTNAKLRQEVSN
jgi:hypothetical protein